MKIISKKKADISMTTIVSAAIAIMVLLVIIMIFTNNIKRPANEIEGVNDDRGSLIDGVVKRPLCESPSPGGCMTREACEKIDGASVLSLKSCQNQGDICCTK